MQKAETAPLWCLAEAQSEFEDLVAGRRLTALWFSDPSVSVDITQPLALRVLDSIAKSGDREAWQRVRRLKAWLLQNTR